jgi:hypothetical protein
MQIPMTAETLPPIATTPPPALAPPSIAPASRQSGPKRKPSSDLAAQTARMRQAIEKLEDQNHRAAAVLEATASLWLSADAKRRHAEAAVALNHFEDALSALRKSLQAT